MENTPLTVRIWTSSHGTEYHHFPQSLKEEYQKKQEYFSLFSEPEVFAKPGRLWDRWFMWEFENHFDPCATTPTLNVILLGGNDIRRDFKRGCCRIYYGSKALIGMHAQSPHLLLLMGSMPSPATHEQTEWISARTNEAVRGEIVKEFNKETGRSFGYGSTVSFFTNEEGYFRANQYFDPDGIHLNPHGARRLAKGLLKCINQMAHQFFD